MATQGPALIVPIDVAALCVGNDDAHGAPNIYGTKDFAAIAADFSALPYLDASSTPHKVGPNIASAILPAAFAPVEQPLSTGVHLHWALPDAITHGVQDSSGKIGFPAAPNRWLVVRIAGNNANASAPTTALSAWVVESDHLWDADTTSDPLPQNAASRAVPLEPNRQGYPNKAYQQMGRVFRLADWHGNAGLTYASKFTALGYGVPSFGAAYEHCPNVFGFHDPLDDLDLAAFPPASSTLSYAIVGWYASLDNDPLHGLAYDADATDADKAAAIAAAMGWTFPVGQAGIPDHIVCNGVLRGIAWNPQTKYVQQRSETNVEVAIGNTTAEAVSALIAGRNPLLSGLETLLNCFQLGLLERMEAPGGAADADESLHQAAFGSQSGGTIWSIRPVTPGNKDNTTIVNVSDADVLAAASRTAALDPAIAPLLNDLNSKQQDCDGLAAEVAWRRSQIFADWTKCMSADYTTIASEQRPPGTIDAYYNFLRTQIGTLNARNSALTIKQQAVTAAQSALQKALPANFEVIRVEAPRYWQPADPVILLTGDDVRSSPRYGGDGAGDPDGNLPCRTSDEIIAAVRIVDGGTTRTAAAASMPTLATARPDAVPAEAYALVAEAMLVDQDRAALVAKSAGAAAGLVPAIQAAQQALASGATTTGPVTFAGCAPSPVGLNAWAQPWIPLILQWQINFYPTQRVGVNAGGDYPPNIIAGGFAMDPDEIDLRPSGALPGGPPQVYQGTIVLAGNPQINLSSQVERYFQNHPDDPNAKEIEQIKDQLDLSGMAQALDGFNQQLFMRAQTLQLPVFDPLAAQRHGFMGGQFVNVTVSNAVADQNDLSALPLNNFNPLRAGRLEVAKLRLVDAFGQVRDFNNPKTIVAHSLQPPAGGAGVIFMPPRIAQPSRLLFRWVSAADDQVETNSHPAATPVCGWVLFNHLDTNLMVYDAAGTPLGSLNVMGPLWQSAPGNGAMTADPNISLAGANPHLRTFVLSIYAGGSSCVAALLDAIDKQMVTINPLGFKQDQGISLLISQPLALVRASLRLELLGKAALDEGWPAFDQAVQAGNADKRPSANLGGVAVPVRLGDLGKLADGLIGYFIDNGAATLAPFYAAQGSGSARVVPLDPNKTAVTPVDSSDESASLMLSMLVDPRGAVHATTGILPVKDISIPPDMYSDALSRIAVTFLTAPVIGGGPSIAIPLPTESGYAWSWVTHAPGGNDWATQPEIPTAVVTGKATWPQRIEDGWLKLAPSSGKS